MNRRSRYFELRSFFLLQAAAGVAMKQVVNAQEVTDLGESVILPALHYKLDLTKRETPRIDFVSDRPLHQLARPRLQPRGMPPYAAVCIRNLRVNPYKVWETDVPLKEKIESLYRSEGSGLERGTLWSMQAFHANKLEWTYRMNPHFAQEARKIAFSVGGAMSGGTSLKAAAALDIDGKPQARTEGSREYLGCANRPAYRKPSWTAR